MYNYAQGDVEALKKNCSPEVIERCRAEHRAYESQGIFFDNKVCRTTFFYWILSGFIQSLMNLSFSFYFDSIFSDQMKWLH